MISQADIIRLLVNKNCTDESILSLALSPNCSPAKLLEKFTEAERFDLALDVSMKLGLDTALLWKSWAMRCLRNRDFKAAQDKFKFCFQRLKQSSSRTSAGLIPSGLLREILNELERMEERKLTLIEEIEQIKRLDDSSKVDCSLDSVCGIDTILHKPSIYAECEHYLREYGNTRDHVRFYVKHSIWNTLIKTLIENRPNLGDGERFFTTDVFMQAASSGRLDDLINQFIKMDPGIEMTRQYFKQIYDYCSKHSRYNLLEYVQHKIGDYVAAAEGQINHIFLSKPAIDYKALAHRLPSLHKAIEYYQAYLGRLNEKKHSISMKNDLKRKGIVKNDLFSEMSRFNVEIKLGTIELQIDITKNFALNEVTGCISDMGPTDGRQTEDNFPVTLFDRSEKRQTLLAALVLVYFDPECNMYISPQGLELAKRLMRRSQLDKLKVYKMAMRLVLEDESFDLLEMTSLLLSHIREEYLEDVKTISKHSRNINSRKISTSLIINKGSIDEQQVLKQQQHSAPTLQTPRLSLAYQEGERVSLLSNFSTLSSTTTTSSSSAASSSSAPLSVNVNLVGSDSANAGINAKTRPPQTERNRSQILRDSITSQVIDEDSVRELAVAQRVPSNSLTRNLSSSRLSSSVPPATTCTIKTTPSILDKDESEHRDAPGNVRQANNHLATTKTSSLSSFATAARNEKLSPAPLQATMIGLGCFESAQALCDEVVRDSIRSCHEADYKMKLAKLLSPEASVELFIELGKLGNAQTLAFNMNRPDYVKRIIEEAEKLNQSHVKIVCQHWLAKHDTQ